MAGQESSAAACDGTSPTPVALGIRHLIPVTDGLLNWWDAGHRNLPWRETTDPYAIWVSEVMLQQTQVATVVPYYERWMDRFPNAAALASAPLEAVLKQWEGLGYYGRARNLHRAAGEVVDRLGGRIPSDPQVLQALPGVGRYTAGAVASIAFGRPVAALDGNVIRVLTRLADLDLDVSRSASRQHLWSVAQSLVPAERPGDFNQALMELGREVCRPARPTCHCCPLVRLCLARRRGTQLERPVRPPRKRIPHYNVTAAVIWSDGYPGADGGPRKVLVAQRPLDDMLGGMWEFPGGKQREGESLGGCLRREIREELGFEVEVGECLLTIEHAYTHFRITLHAFHCRYLAGEPNALQVADFAWATLDQLEDFPFPVTDQKIVAALRSPRCHGTLGSDT